MSSIDFSKFVIYHAKQLQLSGIPEHFWLTLYNKLTNSVFDAGNAFQLLSIEYDAEPEYCDPLWKLQVNVESGMEKADSQNIYLIDHAWTFKINTARQQLLEHESLRNRMASIVGISPDNSDDLKEICDKIYDRLWKYCGYYTLQIVKDIEEGLPIWFMLDEVGCAIEHDEDPNFKVVPFLYVAEQVAYSVLFPIKDVNYGDFITRNFIENFVLDDCNNPVLSLPWVYTSFLDTNFDHVTASSDYFLDGHIPESLPDLSKLSLAPILPAKLRVFSEYIFVNKYLNHNRFELVETENEADILWLTRHFKDFEKLSDCSHKFINQFPFEYVFTIKDLLCITCRRKQSKNYVSNIENSYPEWLPVTYNLKTELKQFASYFQHRQQEGLDNYWIIKPFNLARGLDTYITNNINFIARLPTTGPKIIQKYIANPVLFDQVKFDVRYVIVVKSLKPLDAYIYKNFFLRFANQNFELKDFDEYSKHFTVMNYIDEGKHLKHMLCEEFKVHWNVQYPSISWDSVEESILVMLREALECASIEGPPCGVPSSPQSRAIYAVDILLEWKSENIQPKLLEVNWTPDCKRACEYYPDFYNNIFELLFLNICNSDVFRNL